MSNSDQNEIRPPIEKRSMISELDIKKVTAQARKDIDNNPDYMPNKDVLFLFAVEKLHDIAQGVNEIAEAFKTLKNASQPTAVQKSAPMVQFVKPVISPVAKPVVTPQPAPVTQPVQTVTPVQVQAKSERLIEVENALQEYISLLKFDDASSAQYIIIKTTGFLGGGNFAKIINIIKNTLKGDYVSQGKDSHFRVPKIVQ